MNILDAMRDAIAHCDACEGRGYYWTPRQMMDCARCAPWRGALDEATVEVIDPGKVREFMQGQGLATAERPSLPVTSLILKRVRLMSEELAETISAMDRDDLVGIADGLGDLLYVVIGTALVYGIPIAAVFNEVHASNMTKEGLTSEQKGGKGPGYRAPDLEPLLRSAA